MRCPRSGQLSISADVHTVSAPIRRTTCSRRLRPTGSATRSQDIATPLLITDPEDEHFFPGQPQQLYDLVECPKEIVRFNADEGANGHCEPMARSLRDTRVFDWLDGHLL